MKTLHKINKKVKWLLAGTAIMLLIGTIYFVAPSLRLLYYLTHMSQSTNNAATSLPCNGKPANKVTLRYPYGSYPAQEFTTSGVPLYITVRYIEHGMIEPEPSSIRVDIGLADTPPKFEGATISNSVKNLEAKRNSYQELTLPSGRYWLRANVGEVELSSCTASGITQ